MSSVTTDESHYGTGLWRQTSVMSAASSNLTSSSGADSYMSMDMPSFEKDNANQLQVADQLAFITHRSDHYYQLMDDLAIIDEIYQTFDDEAESEPYERQVADAARNVAQKRNAADQMCQSELIHINDMENFHRYYLTPMDHWISDPANADVFVRFPGLCSKSVINSLFSHCQDMTAAHQEFCADLKERLNLWGPTQFCSDILSSFYDRMTVYESFLNVYPSTVVTLDTLYSKSPAFVKFIDGCVSQANNPSAVKDLLYYLKTPITRLSSYSTFVSQLASVTEPSHPDYRALMKVNERFAEREKEWRTLIKDRLSHMRVLEASRSIQDNPASVTTARRLHITGTLTQVNTSDPQSMADSRTYLLYNDIFMFCQKVKPPAPSNGRKGSKDSGKAAPPVKLQYKGMINLKNAEITPLSAKIIAKISEVKKPSALSSFMRKAESPATPTPPATLFYGFEIKANESSGEMMEVGLDSHYPVPGHASGNGVKRHYIMRTQTEAEQNAWLSLLRKASQQMSRKR